MPLAKDVLPMIDLRTPMERQGIGRGQQTAMAINQILQTIGTAEQKRRERDTLDRVTNAILSGASTPQAIMAAANQGPEFSGGSLFGNIQGGLQRFAGAFQPPSEGGVRQGIQQSILGQALQSALAPPMTAQEEATLGKTEAETARIQAETGQVGQLAPISRLERRKRRADVAKTKAETEALRGPGKASEQKAQLQLENFQRIDAILPAQRTKSQQSAHDKFLSGAPLVEIDLGAPASPAERTAIAETNASIDSLNNIKSLFDNALTRTGPIVGRADPILGIFGWTSQEQEDFMAATSAFKNNVIKEITGAQMSEIEAVRIMKQVPDITDPAARWKAKWGQSLKNLEFLQKRRREVLEASGVRVPEAAWTIVTPEQLVDMSMEELDALEQKLLQTGETQISPETIKPDDLDKMTIEQLEQLEQRILGQEHQTPVGQSGLPPVGQTPAVRDKTTPLSSEAQLLEMIAVLPKGAKDVINQETPQVRSQIWERLSNLGRDIWEKLTEQQKEDTVNQIIKDIKAQAGATGSW